MADDEKRDHEEPEAGEGAAPEEPAEAGAETTTDDAGEGRSSDGDDAEADEDEAGGDAEADEPSADTAEADAEDGEEAAVADASEGAETPAPQPRKKKTGRKKKGSKTTAGQRLAAAKAAKAARKAAARGKQAEILEDKATERAALAATWFERNQTRIRNVLVAVAVLLVVVIGWNLWSSKQNAEASRLLWEATETLNAPIVQADEPTQEEADEDEERYETLAARADAALEKLDAMLASHSGSRLAPYALLLRGKALYQKGEYAEAREAYNKALAEGDENVRARALEGVAFTYEAEENWDEAMARYEELRDIDGLELLADYHIARVHLARGQEVEAKEKLRAILDAFREEDAPNLPYVRDQAELRLMALDSSLVQRDATPDADALRRMMQEQLSKQGSRGG